jgi:hypothetical protein
MAKHLGLRGETLGKVRILLVVVPSFLLFGYNQSAIGGTLSFASFTKYFPRIDTTNTKGALKAENARIQGKAFYSSTSIHPINIWKGLL